ncbi:MAG: Rrf2 family transcriptional regulator, partial [Candidatus Kapabacteria bacterium]|nr:Rrf2 family transcriptional regulator [Candidatus Kapabacteria bacterium]
HWLDETKERRTNEAHVNHSYIQTKEIAEAHGIPYYFLAKLVQDLTRAGLISSIKGPGGGIRLARDPKQITVLDVARSVDNLQYVTDCVIGYEKCSPDHPCPLHYEWEKIRQRIFEIIRDRTLADLVADATFQNGRLMAPHHQ